MTMLSTIEIDKLNKERTQGKWVVGGGRKFNDEMGFFPIIFSEDGEEDIGYLLPDYPNTQKNARFIQAAPQVYNQYLQLVNKVINLVNQINIGDYIDRSDIIIDGVVVDETEDSIHSNIALKDLCEFLKINNNEVKNDY